MKRERPDTTLKILIVDDTVMYRKILKEVVGQIPEATVAGTAANGRLALDKMELLSVDFVLLDVEMPEMDGLETLENLRRDFPDVGVVMVSGVTRRAADITVEALEKGALDFVAKPDEGSLEDNKSLLVRQLGGIIRSFSIKKNLKRVQQVGVSPTSASPPPASAGRAARITKRRRPTRPSSVGASIEVLAIGVSTGGPNALAELIPKLPDDFKVPVLIVQHMPPVFTASLAGSLNKKSNLPVREAEDGQTIEPGVVLIAPGGKHMVVRRMRNDEDEDVLVVGLNENPPENSCRPSVDVLFRSVAMAYGGNVLALIMTGMGDDGYRGVKAMKQRGCYCITQDEDSCIIYGMPRAVDQAGLSDESISLSRLAARIKNLIN